MLSTPHSFIGLAIASSIPNPFISLPLAFFSHYLLDILPHWNWKPTLRPANFIATFIDFSLALTTTLYFTWRYHSPIMILAGLLPLTVDLMDAPYYFFGWRGFWEKYVEINRRYQGRTTFIKGILIQSVVIAVALLVLLK